MNLTGRAGAAAAIAALGAALISVPAAASSHRAAAPTVTVVASGLNSPRHMTFGPGGLYITEAGTGGSSCVPGEGGSFCEGSTGSVALVNRFGTLTLLRGLPSVAEGGEGYGGPAGLTFWHHRLAVLFQDTLVNADGSTSVQGPGASILGKLLLAPPFSGPSRWRLGPDFAAYAAAHPQDPATMGGTGEAAYDSDPYDITPYRGGFAVADAAANDVLWLSRDGDLRIIARLPTVPETLPNGAVINSQAVPTSLAVGPDGALYVGLLRGFPSKPGTADVYRLRPGQAPVAVVTGLTEVSAIAFDHQGRLLVLEYSTAGLIGPPTAPGALLRVSHSGDVSTLPVTGLLAPTGLAVGAHGAVYVANNGDSPGNATPSGEVLRITGLG